MFSLFEGSDSEDAGAGTAPPVAVTVAFDAAHAHVVRVTRGHLAPLTDALRDRDAAETAASFRAAYLAVAQRDCAGCLATARVLTKQAWDRLQAHAHREGSREDDGDDEKTDRLVWRDVYIIAQYLTAICLLDPRRIGDETASAAQRATEAADRAFTVGASVELTQQLVELADLWLPPCCAPAGGANATIPPCDVALIAGAPAIERCADLPTIAHFAQRFFEPRRPVVLEGLASDWPAATKWADVSHFKNAHGRRLVPVEVGRHQEGAWTEELMTFRAFVDEFLLPSNARGVVPLERTKGELRQVGYLAQHALFAQLPSLRTDFTVPPYCDALGALSNVNAWIGTGGTVSPLHFDTYDNFLAQVAGTKYVRLYSPSETPRLYTGEGEGDGEGDGDGDSDGRGRKGAQPNISPVNVERPDTARFPLFAGAAYTETYLRAGDALFIPKGTWHYVRALTTSASVNFWF